MKAIDEPRLVRDQLDGLWAEFDELRVMPAGITHDRAVLAAISRRMRTLMTGLEMCWPDVELYEGMAVGSARLVFAEVAWLADHASEFPAEFEALYQARIHELVDGLVAQIRQRLTETVQESTTAALAVAMPAEASPRLN